MKVVSGTAATWNEWVALQDDSDCSLGGVTMPGAGINPFEYVSRYIWHRTGGERYCVKFL